MYFLFINHSCQKLVIQIFVHLFQFLGFMHVFGSLPASVDVSTVAFFVCQCKEGKLPVVSLFTGIAGLELGLSESGAQLWFHVLYCLTHLLTSSVVSLFSNGPKDSNA